MEKSNTNKYSGLFFKVGLVASMGLALVAFEWKTPTDFTSKVDFGKEDTIVDQIPLTPITEQKRPQPKTETMQKSIDQIDKIKIVDNTETEETLAKVIDFDQDTEVTPFVDVIEVIEIIEKPDVVFNIVEKDAMPIGGMSAFYKYVKKNLEYPRQAKRMGIEGKVIMQFIVNKDGSIVDAVVLRGIGGGCDEEALRIIKNSPKWQPAKQRGNEVRQRMTFPIYFQLN